MGAIKPTLRQVTVAHAGGTAQIETDCLGLSGGWNPTLHLTCHMNGRPRWNPDIAAFVPMADAVPGLTAAGACNGVFTTHECLAEGKSAAEAALIALGKTPVEISLPTAEGTPYKITPLWQVTGKHRAWLDFANDVTTKDVTLSAQEGFRSVEHMKRYTTQGMAPDQGKSSNVTACAFSFSVTNESAKNSSTGKPAAR